VAVHASGSERLKRAEAENQLDQCHELLEEELNMVQKQLEDAAESCGRGLPEDVSAVLRALTPVPTPTHGITKHEGWNQSGHYKNLYERDLRLKLREQALDMLEQTLLFKIQNLVRYECSECSMYEDNGRTSCPSCKRTFHPATALLEKLPNRPLPAGWREITLKSGRVYYTNRIGDAKALASGFFEKPIGQDRSVKPRAMAEWDPMFRMGPKVAGLMEKIWKDRRACGRQCNKCTIIFTDQQLKEAKDYAILHDLPKTPLKRRCQGC
jgi:hypothetical protein